mmetsp:Transcript_87648/g.245343  ORF Transcript_87648/g.245343 Transcript_87648/m.245343 type:complete len:286 (+) Transcript_87648:122-979(+)
MLPYDVRVPAEVEEHAVPLREVDELAGLRMAEGQLSGCAERDADGAILVVRALGVERRRVVVERLPIGAVAVPIESRAVAAAGDGEVCSDPVQNLLVGLGAGRVLAQQVGAFVPRDPFRPLVAVRLAGPHLVDQLVVCAPILLRAPELGDDDDIVVAHGAAVNFAPGHGDDAHLRPRPMRWSRVQEALGRLQADAPIAGGRVEHPLFLGEGAAADDGDRDAPGALAGALDDAAAPTPPDLAAHEAQRAVGLREEDALCGAAALVGDLVLGAQGDKDRTTLAVRRP